MLVAEKKYRDADRILADVIKTFEASGEAALLADALALQGMVWARLGGFNSSINILRRAVEVAHHAGANAQAGQAALTLIEEHGSTWRLEESEVSQVKHQTLIAMMKLRHKELQSKRATPEKRLRSIIRDSPEE